MRFVYLNQKYEIITKMHKRAKMDNLTEYIVTASNSFYFDGDQWSENVAVFEGPSEASKAFEIACNDMETNGSDVTVFLIKRSVPYDEELKGYDFELTEELVMEQKHISLEE